MILKANQLGVLAGAIAKVSIMEARNFTESLFGWITTTMHAMNAVSGPKSADQNWKYICHSVKAIFEHLHEGRTAGQFGGESNQAWE